MVQNKAKKRKRREGKTCMRTNEINEEETKKNMNINYKGDRKEDGKEKLLVIFAAASKQKARKKTGDTGEKQKADCQCWLLEFMKENRENHN